MGVAGLGTEGEQSAARTNALNDFRNGFGLDITAFLSFYDEFLQGLQEHFALESRTLDASTGGLPFWQIRFYDVEEIEVCGGWLPPGSVSMSIAELSPAF